MGRSALRSLLSAFCSVFAHVEGIRAPAIGVTVRVEMNGTARRTMIFIAVRSNVRAVPYLSAGNTRQLADRDEIFVIDEGSSHQQSEARADSGWMIGILGRSGGYLPRRGADQHRSVGTI
jgi:hypothetical protein